MTLLPKIAFFGSSSISIRVLEALEKKGIVPSLLVTQPDRPKGRDQTLTPPPTKLWAEARGIPVFQPEKINSEAREKIATYGCELFIVASYGLILPNSLLAMPKYKTLNIHPSLLPDLRGPSPIQSAILSREKTGVSIMELDREMDHGPLLAQEIVPFATWPDTYQTIEDILGTRGGEILADLLPDWVAGKITPQTQDDSKATYCSLIEKKDGEINLADDAEKNWRKYLAYSVWPGVFFFTKRGDKNIRIIIKSAELKDGIFTPLRVIPEGKKEMLYSEFLKNLEIK